MTRHLTVTDAWAALRRGAAIEQLLGTRIDESDRVLSWIEIDVDREGRYVVCVFQVFDDAVEGFSDVHEFEPFDPDQPCGVCREFDAIEEAMEYAVSRGASPRRFVNAGLIAEEYRDLGSSR